MLPLCSTNAVSAQTDRPSKMLLHRRERWTCRNALPPSAASSPNADDITTTRVVTIYINLKPWVNTEGRAGSKADTPDGTCSLPEPLRFGFCGQPKELCQLQKTVSDSVSIRVNVTFQGFSFSLRGSDHHFNLYVYIYWTKFIKVHKGSDRISVHPTSSIIPQLPWSMLRKKR